MSDTSTNSNQESKENHGSPSQTEQPKATGNMPVTVRDKETEAKLEAAAQDAPLRNPNRTLDKPDIDKPPYS